MKRQVTTHTLWKLSYYLGYLNSLPKDSPKYIAAPTIADALQMGEVSVRKDLASAIRPGTVKQGRERAELVSDLEQFLCLSQPLKVVSVGYSDSANWLKRCCGDYLKIEAHFDPESLQPDEDSLLAVSPLKVFTAKHSVKAAILDVEPELLNRTAELLVRCGIRIIWNCSAAPLLGLRGVIVQNENVLSSLGTITYLASGEDPKNKDDAASS